MDTLEKLNELHKLAQDEEVDVYYYPLRSMDAVYVARSGQCSIGIDRGLASTESNEMEALAHELGHHFIGVPKSSPERIAVKAEYRARRWAVDKLIPWEAFQEALEDPFNDNDWNIAEYFGVSVETLRMAIHGFQMRGLLPG